MTDHTELKRLAEAAIEGPWHLHEERESSSFQGYMVVDPWRCPMAAFGTSNQDAKNAEFVAAANPAEVLALIAENKHLAELLECAQGDLATAKTIAERSMNDAERYRWLRDDAVDPGTVIDKKVGVFNSEDGGYPIWEYRSGAELDSAIDAAMSKEG